MILDLTLERMRQCREIVFERRAEARRVALSDKEIELRTLAKFMALSGGNASDELASSADQIELLKRPEEVAPRLMEIPLSVARKMLDQ